MQVTPTFRVAALMLGLPTLAGAQTAAQPASAPTGGATAAPVIDVGRLPVSLSRIQRRLQASSEREERDGLNLKYFVDVYAPAPPIVLLTKEDNLDTGRVPDSAPSHQDMLRFMTPRGMTPPPTGSLPRRSKKR